MQKENINIVKTNPDAIQSLRVMFLQENNIQFCLDKCHYYGWSDDYIFSINETVLGYGCVWGTDDRGNRDSIFEFFLLPPYRNLAGAVFSRFITVTGAQFIDCQSNDFFLAHMMYEFCASIEPEAILMEEYITTNLRIGEVQFKRKPIDDNNPAHYGGYLLELDGKEVATGGFLTNYNKPYADIYMEVAEAYRGRGYGSFIVQELKKKCMPLAECLRRAPALRMRLPRPRC